MSIGRTEALNVEFQAREVMAEVPSHHGFASDRFGHVEIVQEMAVVLAIAEGFNPYSARAMASVHDLRYWDGPERKARRISIDQSNADQRNAGDILSELVRAGKVDKTEYENFLLAIGLHSKSAEEDPRAPLGRRILRDADKLSRMGIAGLVSIVEANGFYGNVPFYIPEDPIVRPMNSPIIPFKDIKSCITDINSCTGDWVKMMETGAGRILAPVLARINHRFLETFKDNQTHLKYPEWLGWLNQIKAGIAIPRLVLRDDLESERILLPEYMSGLMGIEDPNLVSKASFNRFSKAYHS